MLKNERQFRYKVPNGIDRERFGEAPPESALMSHQLKSASDKTIHATSEYLNNRRRTLYEACHNLRRDDSGRACSVCVLLTMCGDGAATGRLPRA